MQRRNKIGAFVLIALILSLLTLWLWPAKKHHKPRGQIVRLQVFFPKDSVQFHTGLRLIKDSTRISDNDKVETFIDTGWYIYVDTPSMKDHFDKEGRLLMNPKDGVVEIRVGKYMVFDYDLAMHR